MIHRIPPNDLPTPPIDEFTLIFEIAAKQLAKSSDPGAFLDWIAESGPIVAPAIRDALEGSPEPGFRALGVSIYNAMPLPDHDFCRAPLSRPGRNDPCNCGSGRKFKHCCRSMDSLLDLGNYNMLRHVLDSLPRKVFAGLPDSKIDVEMVADTARQWREEGDAKVASQLLEPWFAGESKLTGKLEFLFEELMDTYQELGRERKRMRLLERAIADGDRTIRTAALQRKSTVLADQGDIGGAWEAFQQAQRENPNDPALSMLELTLLVSQGEIGKAKKRAGFWLARAKRDRHINPEIIELLREATVDPAAVFANIGRSYDPDLDQLANLFAMAPAPEAYYRVDISDIGGVLTPNRKLASVEAAWQRVFSSAKPFLTETGYGNQDAWENAGDWLDFLARKPVAWHSFEVLDDLVSAIESVSVVGIDQFLLSPLLQRSESLLEANLQITEKKGARANELPWGFLENRCALRLLAYRAYQTLDESPADRRGFLRAAERLLQLNPMDNHGIRADLSCCYLEEGEYQKVVALAAQYPDDFCTLTLNHILALYRLQRQDQALEALKTAADDHPEAIKMLLAANPRKPRLSEVGVTVGGKDEAWIYREAHLPLWRQDQALEWLRKAWRSERRK